MFWNFNRTIFNNIALIDTNVGKEITYYQLDQLSNQLCRYLKSDKKRLAFLLCDNSFESILSYLSLLRSKVTVLLLDSKLDVQLLDKLISTYKPEYILTNNQRSFQNYNSRVVTNGIFFSTIKRISSDYNIFADTAVLLSTSGTTGSSKLVRLSYKNLQANAKSIVEYLKISSDERPITSLPMSYSYGLSIINSHLLAGATIVLTDGSIVLRNFWKIFNENQCTSFAGVPYSYQLLYKTKFDKLQLPTLRTLTQAGGNLSETYQKYFSEYAKKKKIKFYVMYGQTEATARISFVPPNQLSNKYGSIGIPIPGGKLNFSSDGNMIDHTADQGEIVYQGDNVMLGYATNRTSLSADDELKGTLFTGDLGKKDKDGFFYITGRAKRFIKIFGLRISLDELERMIENEFHIPTACIGQDDKLEIFIQTANDSMKFEVNNKIKKIYKLHNSVLSIRNIDLIPVTDTGKRDYKKLKIFSGLE